MTLPIYLEELSQLAMEEFSAAGENISAEEVNIEAQLFETNVTRTYYQIKKKYVPDSVTTYFSVVAGISNDFTQEQIEIIKDAFIIFAQRAVAHNGNPVTDCIIKYAKTFPRNQALPFPASPVTNPAVGEFGKIYVALFTSLGMFVTDDGQFSPQEYRTLLINRFDQDPIVDTGTGRKSYTLGKAGINIFSINFLLEISLNGKFIGSGSEYPGSKSTDVWAGTITHEILHNLGWEHGSSNTDTYIGEYGDCVERNGTDKSLGLTSYDNVCGTVSS